MIRVILVLLLAASAQAWAGMYKWVDDKGVTHYGDTRPASAAGAQHSTTDEERKAQQEAAEKKREAEKKEAERKRHDAALIDTYSNEKEIDLARDRNLQSVQLSIDATRARVKSVQGRLDGLRKQADSATRSKRPVPAATADDIKSAEAELSRLQENLTKYQEDLNAIRTRFEDDKKRFRELRGGAAR